VRRPSHVVRKTAESVTLAVRRSTPDVRRFRKTPR